MIAEVKRFSDLTPPALPCDEKIDKDSILDLDVEWVDFQELSGGYGDFVWVVVRDLQSDRTLGFSTGGTVVIQKLRLAKKKGYLPLVGKLVKPGRYYDIL